MEQGIIEVDPELQIFYRDIGEGEPVVVIPLACWTEHFDRLATGRRVVYYDPRGRGRSSAISVDQASFEADLADLEAVLLNSTRAPATLIGWSYYGGLVGRYAMLHPERVRAVITVGGMPLRRTPWMEMIERCAAERVAALGTDLVSRMNAARGAEQFDIFWNLFQMTRMARPPAYPLPPYLRVCANEWPASFFPLMGRIAETMGDWDWRDDVRRLTMPLLVIEGSLDCAPEAAREWAEYAPDARLVQLGGVGHVPSLEDPERFFRVVGCFLNGEWPAEATAVA